MVKRFSQNQVERLLDLVPYLTNNQGVALERIAIDFQTDKSTVIDDLNTLWMCGLPGYTPLELIDLSFETGFVSIRNAEVLSKPRKLSSLELATVIVGLSILKESISKSSDHYEAVSTLIAHLLASTNVPAPVSIQSKVDPEIRQVCEGAIKTRQRIQILYHSFAKDIETSREISPTGFQVVDGREYLEAFCFVSNDYRMFRIDRIKSAVLNGPVLENPVHKTDTHVLHNFSLSTHSDYRNVAETFQVKTDSINLTNTEFESSAFDDEWIIRTVCSFNGAVTLTSPKDFRSQIVARAKKAVALYV